ncbi:hypothetical protein BHE74_00035229 [Ensete ventricosum]|nr:hypothetical protein BHE74_00035229 [Ensete ventricosum]
MQWDLVGISLGICRRDREARWEYAGRSLEEDRKTHRKNTGDYHISGSRQPMGTASAGKPHVGRGGAYLHGWSPTGIAQAGRPPAQVIALEGDRLREAMLLAGRHRSASGRRWPLG